MGMNFSPMYQPVSTKTIKADGDLNINPYDLLATDVKCDTVEASEFVGGVGNFTAVYGNRIVPWTLTSDSADAAFNVYTGRTFTFDRAVGAGTYTLIDTDISPLDYSTFNAGFGSKLGSPSNEANLIISISGTNASAGGTSYRLTYGDTVITGGTTLSVPFILDNTPLKLELINTAGGATRYVLSMTTSSLYGVSSI